MYTRLQKKRKNLKIAVVLHNVRSLHNVGSIFRTADAVGVRKIYLCGITPKPLDPIRGRGTPHTPAVSNRTNRLGNVRPQFAKVALGAEKYVEWEYAKRAADVIKKLKKESYKIFAVEQNRESIPYHHVVDRLSRVAKVALIFGNEVSGLTPSILKLADKILEIPMFGRKESLNVSVAFGIAVFGLRF